MEKATIPVITKLTPNVHSVVPTARAAVEGINSAIQSNLNYICTEILADTLEIVDEISATEGVSVDVEENLITLVSVSNLN